MSELENELEKLASPGVSGSDVRPRDIPEKWRPYAEVGTDGGFAIGSPTPEGNLPDADTILREHKLDPKDWIVTNYRHGRWQKYDGEWLESSRITMVPVKPVGEVSEYVDRDLEELIESIKTWRPDPGIKLGTGNGSYVFAPSDQQIGKKAASGGTSQSVDRIMYGTQRGVERLKMLQKMGLNLGTVTIPLPGDHVEGNTSQNGRLQGLAASDLGLTEQTRVARRLLLAQIKAFAPYAERIIVPVVNGNHDEVTRQVAADPADGWNVEIASAVQDICQENPALSHVEFRYPASGHQTLAVDICGTMLGLFHGHQFSTDVRKYLSGQAVGQTALGSSDVWISGHYHHFKSQDIGDRLWVQAPTTDPGSDWFRDRTGEVSRPGILTMVIGSDFDPREWLGVVPVSDSGHGA